MMRSDSSASTATARGADALYASSSDEFSVSPPSTDRTAAFLTGEPQPQPPVLTVTTRASTAAVRRESTESTSTDASAGTYDGRYSRQFPERISSSSQSGNETSSSRGGGGRQSTIRFRRSQPNSNSSSKHNMALRDSMLSRMSSSMGLRDTFFGGKRAPDALHLSPQQEFSLDVIDESGGIDENIGQILKPAVDFRKWSTEGYIVTGIGLTTFMSTLLASLFVDDLNGYTINPGLVFGSLQTLFLCAIVFVTYHGVQPFRAHPNPLILYKCVVDIALALRFLSDPFLQDLGIYRADDSSSCGFLSGVTQFLYLASDSWYFAQTIDLYTSLTNPFTSVKMNRARYKVMVYTIAGVAGLCTMLIPGAHGLADGKYCWTSRGSKTERDFWRLNTSSWLLFYNFMIVFYLTGVSVMVFGFKRLRSGLRVTLNTRREMLRNGAISITSYTIYWTIVFFWYALSFHTRTKYTNEDGDISPSMIFRAFTYTLSGRGAVDYFVWFMTNRPSEIRDNWLKFSSESADKKFSAQLNTALQQELIYFTIEGMTRSIQLSEEELLRQRDRSPSRGEFVPESDDGFSDPISGEGEVRENRKFSDILSGGFKGSDERKQKRTISGKGSFTFDIPAQRPPVKQASTVSSTGSDAGATTSSTNHIRFTPYRPLYFAELRQAYGIKATDFLQSFQTSTKPSISEGASGAFIFFSGDKKYIVKSMAEEEARFLCEIAEDYVEYLITNPSSFITKFYGCFKITLYDTSFYFVVMENLFDVAETGVQIHHRFDIKGSWVNRSYKRPRRGAKVKCRHCSMMFKYGAKKSTLQCPNVVGLHEPNVVLKDNDLRTRMRIGLEEGKQLFEQLREDSLFLCQRGIMDYSLLLGVVDIEFIIDQPKKGSLRRNTATTQATEATVSSSISSDSFVSVESSDLSLGSAGSATTGNSSSMNKHEHEHDILSLVPSAVSAQAGSDASIVSRETHKVRKSKRVFGPGYYYVGVIDILQTWTLQKRAERFWKVYFQQCDAEGLSAIDPVRYQKRFESKLREIIAIPKDYHRGKARDSRRVANQTRMVDSVQRLSPVIQAVGALMDRHPNVSADVEDLDEGRRERLESEDDEMGMSTASTGDDLEQANRNPQPILMQFNQRLVSSSSMRNSLHLTDLMTSG